MALFGSGKKVDELLQATYRGDRQAVFRLVRDGVKTGAKNKSGLAAMHVIAYLSDDRTGIMDNLLFGKADINEPEDNYGWTPLHIAAGMGNLKVAGQLIAKGADVNIRDKHGATPLDMAAAQSEKRMYDFLRTKDAEEGTGTIASGPLAIPVSKVGKAIDAIAEAAAKSAPKRSDPRPAAGDPAGITRSAPAARRGIGSTTGPTCRRSSRQRSGAVRTCPARDVRGWRIRRR